MLLIKIILVVFSYGVNMYIVPKIYISCVYAVISIFQRTLFCSSARSVVCSRAALFVRKRTLSAPVVRCMWLSHVG